ncbi:MAG TPA: DsrE family protein [Pseudomonadales bacterium]|jgi:sulfur relay (sulfurtransferase) complex TusBCD TusD component (DsrE family)
MRYSFCILSAPNTASANTALAFAHALSNQDHSLYRVFFQGEGVKHCEQPDAWIALANTHDCDLVLCSNAMHEYALSCPGHGRFSIGGLILLAEAASTSDRLINWGGA